MNTQFYAHFMVSAIRVEWKDLGAQGFGSITLCWLTFSDRPQVSIYNNSVPQDELIKFHYLTVKYVFHNYTTNSNARDE